MANPDLGVVAISLSGVVCLCQVLLCISVFYLFVKLRQMHQTVERLSQMIMKNPDNHNTDSPPLGGVVKQMMPLSAQPGESITVLHRSPHLPLPTQFVNTEVTPQQADPQEVTMTGESVEHRNEGFENWEE